MILINPLEFCRKDFPIFVVSDDMRSFFSGAIKEHVKDNYSHSMIMVHPQMVATQGFTGFKEIPIVNYMAERYRLKFFQYEELENSVKLKIINTVEKDLKPTTFTQKLRNGYDFLGIVGQALCIPKLNNPWKSYCHERQAKYLRMIPDCQVPLHPNNMNLILESIPGIKCLGYYVKEYINKEKLCR